MRAFTVISFILSLVAFTMTISARSDLKESQEAQELARKTASSSLAKIKVLEQDIANLKQEGEGVDRNVEGLQAIAEVLPRILNAHGYLVGLGDTVEACRAEYDPSLCRGIEIEGDKVTVSVIDPGSDRLHKVEFTFIPGPTPRYHLAGIGSRDEMQQ